MNLEVPNGTATCAVSQGDTETPRHRRPSLTLAGVARRLRESGIFTDRHAFHRLHPRQSMTLSHFYRLAPAAKFCNRFSRIRLGNYKIFARGDSERLKVIAILCFWAEGVRYEFLSPISGSTINVKPMKFIFCKSTSGPLWFWASRLGPVVVNVVLDVG